MSHELTRTLLTSTQLTLSRSRFTQRFSISFAFFLGVLFNDAAANRVWPQPSVSSYGNLTAAVDPTNFLITALCNYDSTLLQQAIDRCNNMLFPVTADPASYDPAASSLLQLRVSVSDTGVVNPYPRLSLDVDESYSITVSESGVADLTANTVFGAMRGLESFVQLLDFDHKTRSYSIQYPTAIEDEPRFAYRGFLIDTARHYLPKESIFRVLDAMAMNKLNVLHWHLVDAESFPVVIDAFPNLSNLAAYDSRAATYDKDTIEEVVVYAYQLGIRVVPEIDVPGHSFSWRYVTNDEGVSVVSECPASVSANVNNFPLDPSQDLTFDVISDIWRELKLSFPDDFIHIGGDEVCYKCWTENPRVSAWMKEQGYESGLEVFQYFLSRVLDSGVLPAGREIMMWEDPYVAGVELPKSTIVHVWSGSQTLGNAVADGYRAINSYGWYLDRQSPYSEAPSHYAFIDTWLDFYNLEPTNNITANVDLIVGGEVCMWGEAVDSVSIEGRTWPRAAAVGERLWSSKSVVDTVDAKKRLIDFSCSLKRRGVHSSPIFPNYCPTEEELWPKEDKDGEETKKKNKDMFKNIAKAAKAKGREL